MARPLFLAFETVNGETRILEHDALKQTDAEIAAGVTPVNYAYAPGPIADAQRYGFSVSASAATNTAALVQAFSALEVISGARGGTVQLPPGVFDVHEVVVPQHCSLIGAGQLHTQLNYIPTASALVGTHGAWCITAGEDVGTLNPGIKIAELAVLHTHVDGHGILLQQTKGCFVCNCYIEGYVTSVTTRTNIAIGIVAGSGALSSFNNCIQNVDANHVRVGHKFLTAPASATNTLFLNCAIQGDDSTYGQSHGIEIAAGQAGGSLWIHGNIEHCHVGIFPEVGASGFTMVGTRFEANVIDISSASGQSAATFLGIETDTEYNVSDANQIYTFVGCRITGAAAAPWLNRIPSGIKLGNTGDGMQKYVRLGTATFAASTSCVVSLSPVEPDTNYRVFIMDTAGGTPPTFRVSKATNQFTVAASASNSDTIDWMLIR